MNHLLGKDAAVAMLRELLHEAEFGSLSCMALRIFRSDGVAEDFVVGGTAQQQAGVWAELQPELGQQ
ncbi:hypothetical protein [Variovorax paradoxus]|uniref:Uncharacterized protein n=1 Tax=Variovorax paradoxus TaxID=34073 RepID=A0A6I6HGC2_VARPD|nr:hypothetical protein [Variovorax paradoxus]QGW81818.1 hypothetical protein GOQ09_09550 [Variovorax paradoxus]